VRVVYIKARGEFAKTNSQDVTSQAMNGATLNLPRLDELHLRHLGLTEALSRSYAEAAAVSLARHHTSPILLMITVDGKALEAQLTWQEPDQRMIAAWNNRDDATRDGAYAVSLASTELTLHMTAIRRAETRTGADYYVAAQGSSLEHAFRLEISGIDSGDQSAIRRRLNIKVTQAREGESNLPALAAVVGFLSRIVLIERVLT
jgi:hypothetical protein